MYLGSNVSRFWPKKMSEQVLAKFLSSATWRLGKAIKMAMKQHLRVGIKTVSITNILDDAHWQCFRNVLSISQLDHIKKKVIKRAAVLRLARKVVRRRMTKYCVCKRIACDYGSGLGARKWCRPKGQWPVEMERTRPAFHFNFFHLLSFFLPLIQYDMHHNVVLFFPFCIEGSETFLDSNNEAFVQAQGLKNMKQKHKSSHPDLQLKSRCTIIWWSMRSVFSLITSKTAQAFSWIKGVFY